MTIIDRLSEKIAHFLVKNDSYIHKGDTRIEGISQEIDILRELKEEIIKRDREIERQKLEWDRTFDSILDNIVLIDRKGNISKVNKSFVYCVKEEQGPWDTLIGMPWSEYREDMGLPKDIDVVVDCYETKQPCETEMNVNDKIFSVVANPIFDENDEIIGVVRISRDVTRIQKQKRKLDRRSRIYTAISKMSKTLVNHDDWCEAISDVLGHLGEAIDASRVYIFKNVNRECRICSFLQHCYHNENHRPCSNKNIVDCINYELLPEWERDMSDGKSVTGNLIDCDLCPEKDNCVCMNDTTISAVPIFAGNKWWGFIGFDYMNGERQWKDEDETLLRIAADILGGVIYHRERYWKAFHGLEECKEQLKEDDEKEN